MPLRLKSIPSFAVLLLLVLTAIGAIRPAGAQQAQEYTPLWDVAQASASPSTGNAALDSVIGPDGVMRFDVAEDMFRFAFADAPVHEDGLPAHGNAFITQGYIYPYGTLSESSGVNPDGSPEFPELVLGEWICRGWFVGEGAHASSGVWVVTTQLYSFGEAENAGAVLVSDGYEIADVGVPVARAITGGTGPFALARGTGEQTFLGFNTTEGVNLRFELAVTDLGTVAPAPVTSEIAGYS
jgi:hypothetical protein